MKINFEKIEGIGNDYVFVNLITQNLSEVNLSHFTREVSDRHFGIGADGAIFVLEAESGENDFKYRMFNADGSEGELCGNGMRGFAKFIYDNAVSNKKVLRIETKAGIIIPEIIEVDENNKVTLARVDMGEPILTPKNIPSTFDGDQVMDKSVSFDEVEYRINLVSMGNPHCVIYVDEITDEQVLVHGPRIENALNYFPNRINVEFVNILSRTEFDMRVWERGSGETLACGTGACAVCVASIINGLLDRKVTVHLVGGDLLVEWDKETNHVFKTGPTRKVFEGIYDYQCEYG